MFNQPHFISTEGSLWAKAELLPSLKKKMLLWIIQKLDFFKESILFFS